MDAPHSRSRRPTARLEAGPLVWVAGIAVTTTLLALLKQALWLVVPFLFAVILYYALYPPVRHLTLAGVRRETAAVLVAGVFFLLVIIATLPSAPWLAARVAGSEEAVVRYLQAGRALLEQTLHILETEFRFLQPLRLRAETSKMIEAFGTTYIQTHLTSAVLGAAAWLPSLLLAPFVAFFLLRDGRRFLEFVFKAVPNAYFERTVYMVDRVDDTVRAYFQGLLLLTAVDTVCLALGLWAIGLANAFTLGLMAAVLAWIPYVGSVLGCLAVALVAATDFQVNPSMVYWAVGLFVLVRLLDDFVFMPLTVGRSLHMHPLPTVLLIFLGGAVAGIPGLILVLPLAGIVMVVAATIGAIIADPRLRARHAFAKELTTRRITVDLHTK